MIIQSSKKPDFKTKISEKGDDYIITHVKDIDYALQSAHLHRVYGNNGFTDDREMRLVGDIPDYVFFEHMDEWLRDPKAVIKWLKSDKGESYRTTSGRF